MAGTDGAIEPENVQKKQSEQAGTLPEAQTALLPQYLASEARHQTILQQGECSEPVSWLVLHCQQRFVCMHTHSLLAQGTSSLKALMKISFLPALLSHSACPQAS
jgi:hypothetical protein